MMLSKFEIECRISERDDIADAEACNRQMLKHMSEGREIKHLQDFANVARDWHYEHEVCLSDDCSEQCFSACKEYKRMRELARAAMVTLDKIFGEE